jgi:hypothetical protein
LIRSAGLPELVCETPETFVARAIALAGAGRLSLRAYRERLIANRDTCTLFDIHLLTRKLEGLYAQMADEYRRGTMPKPNLANLDAYLSVGAAIDHDAIEVGMASDYHGIYRDALVAIHQQRPMAPDGRLWTDDAIEAADAPPEAVKARDAA